MTLLLNIIYLIATITFVVGLKMLGHPATARKGNLIAGAGMVLAIIGTIFLHNLQVPLFMYLILGAALVTGSLIGWFMAMKVKMTKMPELVSLFNGFGGASAMVIGLVEFMKNTQADDTEKAGAEIIATIMSAIVIGAITFTGSVVAWAKLDGSMKDTRLPHYNLLNNVLLFILIAFSAFIVYSGTNNMIPVYLLLILSLLYGYLFVIPIGGADMPVVISLLNSLTGVSAAITGVLYSNMIMLVGGILVGSAGLILTIAMCKAMNRSLSNVIFGAFGGDSVQSKGSGKIVGTVRKTTPSDAAVLMNYASNVVIVPGYGLAVAQAQHVIHELEEMLTKRGVNVVYAIHPVAGRMPGHMNVLLAESNVSYDKLVEMDDINPRFPNTDVVFVVGANDVVNPAAHNDPSSPIYGMPILEVENAKQIIINKRSMNPGYAGIENELFYNQKTSMLFGDAKSAIQSVINELKNV